MPKVSIVVPVCNAEQYLKQCLDSILGQTLRDIEIICVNDGSKDNSGAMLDEYAQRDDRVRVLHKENTGYGNSMNRGLDMARGEYIGIVESDDWVELDMFEKLYQAAKAAKADVVKSNFFLFYGQQPPRDEFFQVIPSRLCGQVFRPLDDLNLEKIDFWNGKPSIWSAIYRGGFVRENGIRFHETPGASYQDASFNFKIWACAQRVFCLDRAFLHYRQDNAGSSVNASSSKAYCVRDEYDEMQRFLQGRPQAELLERVMNRLRFDTYMWNIERLRQPMKGEFARYGAEAFREILAQGRLDQEMFTPGRWKDVQKFVKNPEAAFSGGESGWKKLARRGLRWARGYVQNWTRFYAEKGGMGK